MLKQIVDDFLQHLGYFTPHNIRFQATDRPSKLQVTSGFLESRASRVTTSPSGLG